MRTNTIAVLGAMLCGCGGGSSAVYLTVDSVAPVSGVDHLRVVVMNNGMTSMATDIPLTGRPVAIPPAARVQLRFEGGRSGLASIHVDAADAAGKVLSSGTAMADLQPGREVEARVVLGGGMVADGGVDIGQADMASTISFLPQVTIPSDSQPISLVAADFDRNGHADVAVIGLYGTVTTLLGAGDGTLRSGGKLSASMAAVAGAGADLDADGKPDVAVANLSTGISVCYGKGDGTFEAPIDLAVGKTSFVGSTDMNGDGKPDLVTCHDGNRIAILLNQGGRKFQPASNDVVDGAKSFGHGDLNGDGKMDIVVAASTMSLNSLVPLLGTGTGNLGLIPATEKFYSTAGAPWFVALRDLNGDGKTDMVASVDTAGLYVRLGNGDGSFRASRNFEANAALGRLAAADLDGDGHVDVGAVDGKSAVIVLRGLGDGAFGAARYHAVGNRPSDVLVVDLNEDRRNDLVVTNRDDGNVGVLLNEQR